MSAKRQVKNTILKYTNATKSTTVDVSERTQAKLRALIYQSKKSCRTQATDPRFQDPEDSIETASKPCSKIESFDRHHQNDCTETDQYYPNSEYSKENVDPQHKIDCQSLCSDDWSEEEIQGLFNDRSTTDDRFVHSDHALTSSLQIKQHDDCHKDDDDEYGWNDDIDHEISCTIAETITHDPPSVECAGPVFDNCDDKEISQNDIIGHEEHIMEDGEGVNEKKFQSLACYASNNPPSSDHLVTTGSNQNDILEQKQHDTDHEPESEQSSFGWPFDDDNVEGTVEHLNTLTKRNPVEETFVPASSLQMPFDDDSQNEEIYDPNRPGSPLNDTELVDNFVFSSTLQQSVPDSWSYSSEEGEEPQESVSLPKVTELIARYQQTLVENGEQDSLAKTKIKRISDWVTTKSGKPSTTPNNDVDDDDDGCTAPKHKKFKLQVPKTPNKAKNIIKAPETPEKRVRPRVIFIPAPCDGPSKRTKHTSTLDPDGVQFREDGTPIPFARPEFPTPIHTNATSSSLNISPSTVLRVCFRIGEVYRAFSLKPACVDTLLIELYGESC